MDRRLITREQAAALLGVSTDYLARQANLDRLEADGFPPPVSLGSRLVRWDSKAIHAWLDARMPAHLRPADREEGDGIDDLLERRAEELRRAG